MEVNAYTIRQCTVMLDRVCVSQPLLERTDPWLNAGLYLCIPSYLKILLIMYTYSNITDSTISYTHPSDNKMA